MAGFVCSNNSISVEEDLVFGFCFLFLFFCNYSQNDSLVLFVGIYRGGFFLGGGLR